MKFKVFEFFISDKEKYKTLSNSAVSMSIGEDNWVQVMVRSSTLNKFIGSSIDLLAKDKDNYIEYDYEWVPPEIGIPLPERKLWSSK